MELNYVLILKEESTNSTEMKSKRRVIVDYKKLTSNVLQLLVTQYPDGYEDETICFNNAKGERIECVEVITKETVYLVKVSAKLQKTVANFDEDEFMEIEPTIAPELNSEKLED